MDSSLLRQILIGIICNLLIIDSGFHEGWSTPMIPKLLRDDPEVRISQEESTWIVNLLYFGVGVGSLIPLLLMDRIGRKWTMFVAAIPKISSWLIFALGRDSWAFYAGRFLAGVGTGITYCVTPMYLGEISTKQTRGPLSASLAVWINVGLLAIYGIGLWSTRLSMSLVSCVVPLSFALSFAWLPKSAVFLAKRRRFGQAERVLKWSLGRDNVDLELEEIKRIVAKDLTRSRNEGTGTLERLGRIESRRAFNVVAILLSAMIFSGAAPILAYQVETFEEAGFGSFSTETSVMVSGATIVVSGIACVLLVSYTGKRPLLLVAAPATVASHAFVAGFFTLQAWGESELVDRLRWVPTVFTMTYALFYGLALNPLPLSYISEVFPVDVKVPAAIFTSVFYAAGSVFVVDMYQKLRQWYGTHVPFWCFSAISLFLWLLIYLYVPETEGKSLEEIQLELKKRPRRPSWPLWRDEKDRAFIVPASNNAKQAAAADTNTTSKLRY